MRRMHGRAAGLLMILVAATAPWMADQAAAGWLSRIVRGAGETSGGATLGKAGKLGLGLGALDNAAAHVAALPKLGKGAALAAHITPEGHWKFANREGQVFTAATPDELARVGATLAPEAQAGEKLALYLSEDTVFANRAALKDLPDTADLHVVVDKSAYRLRRGATLADVVAEVRPNIALTLTDRAMFEEAIHRLARPLNRSDIRVLALETGGPRTLSSVPRFDPATKAALVDQVDPSALENALAGLKGQTAVISGRVEGGTLKFRPSKGPEQSLDIAALVQSAEAADVNLVVIGAGASHQPGGRNWLWQRVAVAGLDDALQRATFADFLASLGDGASELMLKASPGSHGRVVLSATPQSTSTLPLGDTLGEWMGEITGHVAVKSVEVFARDSERERELDSRIIPGIPSGIQIAYLSAAVLGVLSLPVLLRWWSRIWPQERREEYAGRVGFYAAKTARWLAFIMFFLPAAGIPAFAWTCLLMLRDTITAPFRALGWLRARLTQPRA